MMSVKSKLCGDCGNNDPIQFRHYRNPDEELIGKYCKKCQVEWLKAEYIAQSSNQDVTDYPAGGTNGNLYKNKPEAKKVFQGQSAKKIDTRFYAEILKPGDHIAWHRALGYWHHAIVSEVKGDKNDIKIIHWSPNKQIKEELHVVASSNGESLFNQMHRIDYSEDVTNNIPELVLARARSRISEKGYNVLTDNCEGFATYCKTGCAKSHQVAWLLNKIKEIIGICPVKTVATNIVKTAAEVIPGEIVEELLHNSQLVGVGIVLLIEGCYVIWDISQAYAKRKNGDISRCGFVEAIVQRIIAGVVAATATAGLSYLCEVRMEAHIGSIGGRRIGILIGGIAGGIFGGLIGGVIGRAVGIWAGNVGGKILATCFQNDEAVKKVSDLKPGDHIVLNGGLFHPRCHAILVDYEPKEKGKKDTTALTDAPAATNDDANDSKDNASGDDDDVDAQILVIRNTHQHGVVKEPVKFEKPLIRVEYKKGECLDPDQVLKNAESKIGQYRYDLATYNCKTFARRCKTVVGFWKQPSIGKVIGTNLGRATGAVVGCQFSDESPVMKASDLKAGDHIVMKGWSSHPRCHAIVVESRDGNSGGGCVAANPGDKVEGQIQVIRNTYEHGIVKEWVTFEQPLYRKEYEEGECLEPDHVLKNAESKIGQYRYDLTTYNCKTFARRCKTVVGFWKQPSIGKVIGTDLGRATGAVVGCQFSDESPVMKASDLKSGDHIVMKGWSLHPRCHAIVVESRDADDHGDGTADEVESRRLSYCGGGTDDVVESIDDDSGESGTAAEVEFREVDSHGDGNADVVEYKDEDSHGVGTDVVESRDERNLEGGNADEVASRNKDSHGDDVVVESGDCTVEVVDTTDEGSHAGGTADVVEFREGSCGGGTADVVETIDKGSHEGGIADVVESGDCTADVVESSDKDIHEGGIADRLESRNEGSHGGGTADEVESRGEGSHEGDVVVESGDSTDDKVESGDEGSPGDCTVVESGDCNVDVLESRQEDDHEYVSADAPSAAKPGDKVEGQILVIRNTYDQGIVKEWVTFEKPLYRKEYKNGDCLDHDQVLKNAESKIGQRRYNIATYNCKTFATRCKTVDGFSEQPL